MKEERVNVNTGDTVHGRFVCVCVSCIGMFYSEFFQLIIGFGLFLSPMRCRLMRFCPEFSEAEKSLSSGL